LQSQRGKVVTALRRIVFALALALLMFLLGFFANIGYHVVSIKELPYPLGFRSYGYSAVGRFYCDIVYNPILYPYYWFVGVGRYIGNFSMIVLPTYGPGEQAYPIYPGPEVREGDLYLTSMLVWGMAPNMVFLLFITTFLEIINKRIVYLVLTGGTLGFAVASVIGLVVGSLISVSAIVYLLVFNKSKMAVLRDFWNSLWE
jgi:hypothetical protein